MKKTNENLAGFTLLEVLLSMALFSIIALTTIKQITLIRNTKDTAFKDVDAFSNARSALNAMETDIRQAFHVLYDDLGPNAKQTLQQGGAVTRSLFDGKRNQLTFTSLSHRNYFAGKRESEQTEITFSLQSAKNSNKSTLVKRESELIDDNPYEGGSVYTLLENVESLEFQYFDPKTQKWEDSWNSDSGVYRDKFPSAVKIKILVAGANNKAKPLTVETQFKISFPNNEQVIVRIQ
ncbi:MAG: prepilin-type N-terminal cleavage/methylation domain-containing protein [Proteobacteria bacterium]|nr:prepilin-type N-terminal cleavage/methylation domain-containing protein [Pseudomonadota bacterium]